MLEVVVKTLDSQNHSFSVPEESTVKEFKAQIAPVLNIAADKQRLIFCGKVLKDDKKLNEYDVNGKVIHVVQSLPPQSNTSSSSTTSSGTSRSNVTRDAAGFLLGAFAIPQDMVDPSQVQNIVQDVAGLGDIGRNATVVSRTSDDGSVDVHINLGRVPVQVPLHSEAQLRMNRIQTMLIRANHLLESIEDGSNSGNGAVAESSSQTETENAATRSNGSDSQAETLLSNIPDATITAEVNISPDMPTEINLGNVNLSAEPEGFRFEGLAHAAQAAISAAFAAAARAATSSLSSPEASPPGQDDSTSEPMDVTPSPVPDSPSRSSTQPEDPSDVPMDALPSDSEPSTSEQASSKKESSAPAADSESHHPGCPFSAARTPPTTTAPSSSQSTSRPRAALASVQTLANLLDEVIRLNTRLQPCLERCRDLIRSDSLLTGRALGDAQRLFSRISQLMHFLGHAYHSLSDLYVNFTQEPPRSPSVRIISSSHNPPLFQGIPMQAQISISTSSVVVPNTSQSTTTTASNVSNDSSANPNTEARPVPAPRVSQPSSTPNPLSYMAGSQSPVVFMEVSPGSVTIDSISSIAVNSLSGANSDASQASGPRPNATPSSTSGRDNQPAAPEPTTGTPRATPPRSSSANSSAPQQMNIPFQNLIPVPLTSMGSLHSFDAGLPCNSVWALEPSRRRHNAGGSRSSSSSGVTPNAPGRQEDQLQQIIGNIMMSLLNHVPTELNRNVPRNSNAERTGAASDQASMRQTIEVCRQKLLDLDLLYKTVSDCLPNLVFDSQTLCGRIMNFLTDTLTINSLMDLLQGKFGALDKYEAKFNTFIQRNIMDWNKDVDDKKQEMQQVVQEFENIIRSCSFLRERRGRKDEFYRAINVFARDYVFKIYKAAGISKLDQSPKFGENLMRHLHFAFLEFVDILKRNTIDGFKDIKTEIMLELARQTSTLAHNYQATLYEFFSLILSNLERSYDLRHYNARSRSRSNPNFRSSTAGTSSSASAMFPGVSVSDLAGSQHLVNEFVLPWMSWSGPPDMLESPVTVLSGQVSSFQFERLREAVTQQFTDLRIIDKKLEAVVRDSIFDTSTLSGAFMKFLFEILTFRDLIDIMFKSYACINKYVAQFREFVSEHFFDINAEVIDLEKLRKCFAEVKKMILSFCRDMVLTDTEFEEHLDRYFTKCAEVYVPDIVKALIDDAAFALFQFGPRTFTVLMKAFKEFVVIIARYIGVDSFVTKGIHEINEESFGLTGRKKQSVQSLFKNAFIEVIFRTPMNQLGSYGSNRNAASSSSNSGASRVNRGNAAGASQESQFSSNLAMTLRNLDENDSYSYQEIALQWRPVSLKTLGEIFTKSSSQPQTTCEQITNFVLDNIKFVDLLDLRFGQGSHTLGKYYKKFLQFIQDNLTDDSSTEQLKKEIKTWLLSFSKDIKIPDESKFASELDQAIESSVSQLSHIKDVSEVMFQNTLLSALKNFFMKLYDVYHRYTENGVYVIRQYIMNFVTYQIEFIKRKYTMDVETLGFVKFFFDDLMSQLISEYHEKIDPKDKKTTGSNGSETPRATSTPLGRIRRITDPPRPSRGAPNFAQFVEQNSLLRNSSGRQRNIPPVHGLTRVVIGSEGWHNTVPRDWVPIIARDVHCQRRQASQAPFSNAYLSGMPSKRRKIMTNSNTTLLEHSQSALSDMLMQAILSADVKPKTNIEEVKKEAAQDAPLQVSFNEHMKQAIRERLNCDGDYCSERFPNSEKYFN